LFCNSLLLIKDIRVRLNEGTIALSCQLVDYI